MKGNTACSANADTQPINRQAIPMAKYQCSQYVTPWSFVCSVNGFMIPLPHRARFVGNQWAGGCAWLEIIMTLDSGLYKMDI